MRAKIEIVGRGTGHVRPFADLPIPGVANSGAQNLDLAETWDLRITADSELQEELADTVGDWDARWSLLVERIYHLAASAPFRAATRLGWR